MQWSKTPALESMVQSFESSRLVRISRLVALLRKTIMHAIKNTDDI